MLKEIGTGVASVTTGTAVDMDTTPFIAGGSAELVVDCDAFNGTVVIEGSDDDGDTYSTVATITESGSDRTVREQITLNGKMRYDCTARTAGEVDIHVRAGD